MKRGCRAMHGGLFVACTQKSASKNRRQPLTNGRLPFTIISLRAGLVHRENGRFPSHRGGFDSRTLLQKIKAIHSDGFYCLTYRPCACGQQPIPRPPFSGARESRERYAASGRQPFPRQLLSGARELRSNTPLPGWGFRALRSAGTGRSRGGRLRGQTTYGFPPS